MPLVVVQQFLLSLLQDLELPYNVPAAKAYVTPPDPRVQAKVPAIYIWPSDGQENRSASSAAPSPATPARTPRPALRACCTRWTST